MPKVLDWLVVMVYLHEKEICKTKETGGYLKRYVNLSCDADPYSEDWGPIATLWREADVNTKTVLGCVRAALSVQEVPWLTEYEGNDRVKLFRLTDEGRQRAKELVNPIPNACRLAVGEALRQAYVACWKPRRKKKS